MTIDKIKHYMSPEIFNHWANCQDVEIMTKAAAILESEINEGLLVGIQYVAELEFLQMKLS